MTTKSQKREVSLPTQLMRAAFQPSTLDTEARTVELTWSTGAQVRRYDWFEGPYIEELSMDPKAVRMDRLNNGAPLLGVHNSYSLDSVLGVVEKAWLTNGEGRAVVRFSSRPEVDPILQDVKDGILRNISVGYNVYAYEQQKVARGETPIFRATDWEPMEISIVPVPADASAQIRSSSELHPLTVNMRNTEMADPETEAQGENAPAPAPAPAPAAEVTAEQVRNLEMSRIRSIRELVKKVRLDESIADKLIESGSTIEHARAHVLDVLAAKSDATAVGSGRVEGGEDSRDKRVRAATAAILYRTGGKVAPEELQGNEYVGLRLSDYARMALEEAGINTRGMSYMSIAETVLRAQTTSDFPVLLENTMHKMLLDSYQTAPDVWRQFCKIGSVSDFRLWKRLETGTLANLAGVNEHGEYANINIPDAVAESVQATRNGNIIAITPEIIVNDDFNWISDQSVALGRAAARTIEAAVFAKLVANPTLSQDSTALFHANHGNLSGTSDAIAVASLDAARVAMRSQKDLSGNDYLDIRPKVLLCPVGKGGTARVTINSQYDPDTANKLQRENIAYGIVQQIIDTPRLTGNSWYLFADPNDAPVIEVVFLDGVQTPRLSQDTNFRTSGLSWKVELPFGVGVIGFKGAYKNNGA